MNLSHSVILYSRKRWGRGFQYFDPKSQKVKCRKLLTHFTQLAVPPMWVNVEIVGDPSVKIQATGRDAKNRKQYIYSEFWQKQQQQKKFDQMVKFASKLPSIRSQCTELLDKFTPSKNHVLALMVLVLDETGIRIGNQRYTQLNDTFGLSTLRRKHLVESDNTVLFEFTGKGSKARAVKIEDEALMTHIKLCAEYPGYNIFKFKDEGNQWQNLSSDDVNTFIKSKFGKNYSAKDFRTWVATCLAVEAYIELFPFAESRSKPINQVVKQVSQQLGNTAKICKDYYIHPIILNLIETNMMSTKLKMLQKDSNAADQKDDLEKITLALVSNRKKC